MANVKYAGLLELMPGNLLEDKAIRNATEALDKSLKDIDDECVNVLIISRIDELDDEVLDLLAWQWHVDSYDTSYSLEIKRNLIRQSIDWHRHKGTPYAVKSVLKAIISEAEVIENWEYSGDPYCFRVNLKDGITPDTETINKVVNAIMDSKNVRSQLDGMVYHKDLKQTIYFGGAFALSKTCIIGMQSFRPPKIDENLIMAGVMSTMNTTIIKEA